jgi:hypothetical protein
MLFKILTRHILLGAIVTFLIFWIVGELPYLTMINDRIWIWLCILTVTLLFIWTISKVFKRQLMRQENSRRYVFSSTFILTVWLMLFLTTAIIDGLFASLKSGQFEILDYLEGYVIYRLWVYLGLGVLHGLIGGLFLSLDLKSFSKNNHSIAGQKSGI